MQYKCEHSKKTGNIYVTLYTVDNSGRLECDCLPCVFTVFFKIYFIFQNSQNKTKERKKAELLKLLENLSHPSKDLMKI